ncbi:hypothetical protein GOP47_0003711, partial [Adiantum capillus-veneris]
PPLQKSTQSSCKPTDQRMTPFPVHPDARAHPSSVNVVDLAHTILARLEQLEMQQRAANRTPKLHHLSKKGSACKVGVDQKICRQRKGSFGEKGLLQLVRRRVKGDMPHAFGGQDSAKCKESITKHGDQETEKRFQRLENELELCWSAINQLCIDNEHFREEQRRWTQRTGTLQQLNENHLHVKPTYTSPKSKVAMAVADCMPYSSLGVGSPLSRSTWGGVSLVPINLVELLLWQFLVLPGGSYRGIFLLVVFKI